MADKVSKLIETGLSNDGKRSTIDSFLGPGATTFPHYHTLFAESFKLVSGSLRVLMAPEGVKDPAAMKEYQLEIGETATVPRHTAHKFLAGEEGCRALASFEPAAVDFERVVLIIRGLQADAEYKEFGHGADAENALLLSVLGELSDSHPLLGNDVEILSNQEKEKVVKMKQELIDKYATNEMILKAVGNN